MALKLTTKLIIAAFFLIVIIILGLSTGVFNFSVIKNSDVSEHRLVLQRIEDIGNLELVRYNFNDVVEESVIRKLFDIDNLAPDSKVLVIVNGEATACVNLKEVTKNDIKTEGDDIIITLPTPVICYTKINHDRSKIYDANFTARIFNPELIDKAYKQGEIKIKDEAIKLGILEQAKKNARKLLGPFLGGITRKNIKIEFKVP
ncbi:MAG: DUF4230 domain-containing protein [Ignavibacteriaceae bacterium]